MATGATPQLAAVDYFESYSVPESNRFLLDETLDFDHGGVQTDLGTIADSMVEWEGRVAEELKLTGTEVAVIKTQHPGKLDLQTRAALKKWQEKCGSDATYRNLILAFHRAEKGDCAEAVCEILRKEPYISVGLVTNKGLTPREKDRLVLKLTQDTMKVIKAFQCLVDDTFESLDDQSIPVDKLRAVAINYARLQEVAPEDYDKFSTITSIYDVQSFLIGKKYISFLNYEMLEKIITKFLTGNAVNKLEEYIQSYKDFCRRSVFEVPSRVVYNSAPDSKKEQILVVKVDRELWYPAINKPPQPHLTLNDVSTLKVKLAEVLGLDLEVPIFLKGIEEGCVKLTFVILSKSLTSTVLPLARSKLKRFGVTILDQQKSHQPEGLRGRILRAALVRRIKTGIQQYYANEAKPTTVLVNDRIVNEYVQSCVKIEGATTRPRVGNQCLVTLTFPFDSTIEVSTLTVSRVARVSTAAAVVGGAAGMLAGGGAGAGIGGVIGIIGGPIGVAIGVVIGAGVGASLGGVTALGGVTVLGGVGAGRSAGIRAGMEERDECRVQKILTPISESVEESERGGNRMTKIRILLDL